MLFGSKKKRARHAADVRACMDVYDDISADRDAAQAWLVERYPELVRELATCFAGIRQTDVKIALFNEALAKSGVTTQVAPIGADELLAGGLCMLEMAAEPLVEHAG